VDKRVSAARSRLGVACRIDPAHVEQRRRELDEAKLEVATEEFQRRWPTAWPALKERLGTLIGSGANS
jgi:hypothetical protein